MARIGPVLPSGKFFMNYSGKLKSLAHKKANLKVSKSLTKTQKKAVKKIVNKAAETKYHSELLLDKFSLDYPIHSYADPAGTTTTGDILPLVPRIPQGTNSNDRVGRTVRPVKCKVSINASLLQNYPGGFAGTGTDPTLMANEIYVVMYILKPKTCKNYRALVTQASATPNNDYLYDLLDNGDGTNSPFANVTSIAGTPTLYTNISMLHKPVNREYFTLVKRKVVKLSRNVGYTTYDQTPGNAPNTGKSNYNGTISFKLPKLIYDDFPQNTQQNGGYPTNTAMLMAIGCVLTNGNDSLTYAGNPPAINGSLPNPIQCTVRTHYYYKDE